MRIVIAVVTGLVLILGAWLFNQESSNNDTEGKSGQTAVDPTVWIIDATENLGGERIVNADEEPGN